MSENKKFYPDYLIEIVFVIFIAIEAVIILAMLYPEEIGRQINFSAPFQPKPEWYFLWLYEIVKYFPGKTAFLGTVLIPVAFTIILIMIPFIDKKKYGRIKAIIAISTIYIVFLIFTLIPIINSD